MRPFRDFPIRRKLTMVLLLSGGTALLLFCLALVGYEYSRVRDKTYEAMNFQAKIVEANAASALAFDDPKAARETLTGLSEKGDFVCARLFRMDGRLFAEYVRPEKSGLQLPARYMMDDLFQFTQGQGMAVITRGIKFEGERIGVITIQADLSPQQQSFRVYARIVLGVMLATLTITLLTARKMQTLITQPLLELAALTRSIRKSGNYSLQAPVKSRDEIGQLAREFNEMLAQIKSRDEALQANEERFRQVAENIEEVFWMTSADKREMIYISPAYERIWGRSCVSLYTDPKDWINAIHPDDRQRVLKAALHDQASGDYDLEYRIIRPDGTMRWIRDRAFPVKDFSGKVYRITGIAEDMTDKRRLEREIHEISEREQSRIGQDLHDGLCQQLVRIALTCNVLEQDLAKSAHPQATKVRNLSLLAENTLIQARSVARGLFPVKLEKEGLTSALEEMALSLNHHAGVRINVACDRSALVSDHEVAVHLYRIAQEAVTNALKHASARHIDIQLTNLDDFVSLKVQDDGVGIEHPTGNTQGMGLNIMAYRAHLIGGKLRVYRGDVSGTVVSCSVAQKAPVDP